MNFGDFERKSLSATDPSNSNSDSNNNDITIAKQQPQELFTFSADRHFDLLYNTYPLRDGLHLVVVEAELGRQIGMVTLVDNDPANLSIRIGE